MKAKFTYEGLNLLKSKDNKEIIEERPLFFKLYNWANSMFELDNLDRGKHIVTTELGNPIFAFKAKGPIGQQVGLQVYSTGKNDGTLIIYPAGVYSNGKTINLFDLEDLKKALKKYKSHLYPKNDTISENLNIKKHI